MTKDKVSIEDAFEMVVTLLKQSQKQLSEANEVIEFYGHVSKMKHLDKSFIKYNSTKKAREYLTKWSEK